MVLQAAEKIASRTNLKYHRENFFRAANQSEYLKMSFSLYRHGKRNNPKGNPIIRRNSNSHWWLTKFILPGKNDAFIKRRDLIMFADIQEPEYAKFSEIRNGFYRKKSE